jgi:hypothetical protein
MFGYMTPLEFEDSIIYLTFFIRFCTMEDKGNHPTVDDAPVYANLIFGLYSIDGLIVNFILCIGNIRFVASEFGTELWGHIYTNVVAERLEDFGEEDVFIAEEPERMLVEEAKIPTEEAIPDIITG